MPKTMTACFAALVALLPLVIGGCASAPSSSTERNFESPGLTPSSPDSFFGVSGDKDSSNSYLSTLSLRWLGGTCSGVLVSPHAVLTSAHCFCLPPDFASSSRIYDSADCAKNAPSQVEVFTVYYQDTGSGRADIPIIRKGTVITHESFRSEIRNGAILGHQADIALVRLSEPLSFDWQGRKRFVVPDDPQPDRDISLGELLTIAGYGPSVYGSRSVGVRRVGTNMVTDIDYSSRPIPASTNGVVDRRLTQGKREFRFRATGAHTRSGDSGGPVFRTEGNKRWLVGVNGGHANQGNESWFTSTFPYKDWLETQLARLESQ